MLRLFLIAGGVLLVQACTVVVAGDEQQCGSDEDCASRGFDDAICVEQACVAGNACAIDEDCADSGIPNAICLNSVCTEDVNTDPVWGCLGNVVEPTPDTSKTVQFEVRLAYALGGAAVTTAVVDICDKLDVTCSDSSPDFPKGLSPDPAGIVDIEVREGFDGFVQVTGPEIVDSRIYVGRPIVEPPSVEEVQMLRPEDYEQLAGFAGQTIDTTRGTAIVLVVDCSGDGVGGVRFETASSDGDTLEFYLINQFPTAPPDATTTDADGFGGFFNLKTGPAVMRAFRDVDDTFIGESSFQILANTISYVLVAPTPQ